MFTRSEQYAELGHEVIKNIKELNHLQSADCRIDFMASDKVKTSNGKNVLGECIKVQELYKEYCPYDFLIVIYERNCIDLDEDQLKILLEHELLHVGFEVGEDGVPKYSVRPHDYDDFKQITDKYGTDWAKKC